MSPTPAPVRTNYFEIKQGDTRPLLATTLRMGKTPLDLTGATGVLLTMVGCSYPNTKVLDLVTVDFIADATGSVSYDWAQGGTAEAGEFDIEWTVVWPGGFHETVPSGGYDRVKVIRSLSA